MSDITEVTGIVLSAMPVGEFDRRIVILTKERGKIAAFAKGARRPNSPLTGITRPFVFGTFQVYEGRTSYTIRQANITAYFEEIISDFDAVCYAYYFAELADYYGRENLDASVMINLLYAALKALGRKNLSKPLIRLTYELRIIAINGESPDFFVCQGCGKEKEHLVSFSKSTLGIYCEDCADYAHMSVKLEDSTVHALQYITGTPLNRLFSFAVNKNVLMQLMEVITSVKESVIDKKMKSFEMLSIQEELNA